MHYLCTLHEQTGTDIHNDSMSNIPINAILTLYLRNASFRQVRLQYTINYNTITVLLGCYVFSKHVKEQFTITDIVMFTCLFNGKGMKRIFNKLLACDLITLAGSRHYKLTEPGQTIIKQVNDNYNTVLYQFCQKYNITL